MQGAEAVRSSNYRPQKTTKEEEDKRIEIGKIQKFAKDPWIHQKNKIKYMKQILKLKHEKDTAEEVMKALHNANFNKIQISSATDKEQ